MISRRVPHVFIESLYSIVTLVLSFCNISTSPLLLYLLLNQEGFDTYKKVLRIRVFTVNFIFALNIYMEPNNHNDTFISDLSVNIMKNKHGPITYYYSYFRTPNYSNKQSLQELPTTSVIIWTSSDMYTTWHHGTLQKGFLVPPLYVDWNVMGFFLVFYLLKFLRIKLSLKHCSGVILRKQLSTINNDDKQY